ncbi:hypothetical protein STA3757_12820 [Stanieria sp. NIES-3757]|nr:hypothetical protein STA3757_12820 [Stanieria sp. NIES-3757]
MALLSKEKISLNLRSLDALRGILAIYVVLGHCRWLLWVGNSEWNQYTHPWWANFLALASAIFRYGHEAVMIFFVLSGFFIHLRISQQLANNKTFSFDIISFYKRRCHRLIPPYFFALALTVIIDLVGMALYPSLYNGLTGDALLDSNFLKKGFSYISVLPALFVLPSSLGQDFGSNGPLWSLAYEIFYYLIYPFWLILRRLGVWQGYLGGIGLAIIAVIFLEPSFISSTLIHYPIWLSGAFLAEQLTKKRIKKSVVIISIILSILSFISINLSLPMLLKLSVYAIFGFSIVFTCVNLPFSVVGNYWHSFFESLGKKSYTIYICHFPIITIFSAWSIEVLGTRPMAGWLACSVAIFTLLFCHVCFLLCEQKFLHDRLKV